MKHCVLSFAIVLPLIAPAPTAAQYWGPPPLYDEVDEPYSERELAFILMRRGFELQGRGRMIDGAARFPALTRNGTPVLIIMDPYDGDIIDIIARRDARLPARPYVRGSMPRQVPEERQRLRQQGVKPAKPKPSGKSSKAGPLSVTPPLIQKPLQQAPTPAPSVIPPPPIVPLPQDILNQGSQGLPIPILEGQGTSTAPRIVGPPPPAYVKPE